jgi:pimeloyl-ACP methyl ester carboxylesterase
MRSGIAPIAARNRLAVMMASSGGAAAYAGDQVQDLPQVDGVEHRFVDADGLRVHVAEAGDGPPVLLLHGWPQHWYMWREVIERLAPQFRLIAPDLRGFGWTEAPGSGYDADTFARDQVALLDALEIESASVIAHDWGGWTAFMLALDHADRIERMVLCNEPHPWPQLKPSMALETWRSWYALLNAVPGVGAMVHQRTGYLESILRGASSPIADQAVALYVARYRDPARARAASALYRYYWRAYVKGLRGAWRSKHLSVPTLLLFGKRDRFVPYQLVESGFEPYADEMEVELVPDSGHFLVDEKPDLVARRALAFLS